MGLIIAFYLILGVSPEFEHKIFTNRKKKMKALFKKICLVTLLTAASITAANAAVIFQDDFEADTVGVPVSSLINWDITAPTLDLVGGSSFGYLCNNNAGGNCIDMEGSPGNGAMTTKTGLNLLAGSYVFSFDFGNNGTSDNSMLFSLGNIIGGTINSGAAQANIYEAYNIGFTLAADVNNVFISFASAGSLNNQGTILDNVRLESVSANVQVPAPGIALFLMLGIVGLFLRKK